MIAGLNRSVELCVRRSLARQNRNSTSDICPRNQTCRLLVTAGHSEIKLCNRKISTSDHARLGRLSTHPKHRLCKCHATEDPGDDGEARPFKSNLSSIIRRKHLQLQARIADMGVEALESQLQTAATTPRLGPDFRLTRLISKVRENQARPLIVAEVKRRSGVSSPAELVDDVRATLQAGADTIAICTDAEATPKGLADLFAVCRAVTQPVVVRDWFLHPIQVVDAREAGAASVLGIVESVTASGSAILSSFASALGMEAPVEVVNKQQSDDAEANGIPFIAVSVGVSLSIAMPSVAAQIARALITDQPFANQTMMGVRTLEDVRQAKASRADCIFVGAAFYQANSQSIRKRIATDAPFEVQRQACLEEVLDILDM